jgi:hypothetical protein
VSSLEVPRGSTILGSIIAKLLVDSRVIGLVVGSLVVSSLVGSKLVGLVIGSLVASLLVVSSLVVSFYFLALFVPYILL